MYAGSAAPLRFGRRVVWCRATPRSRFVPGRALAPYTLVTAATTCVQVRAVQHGEQHGTTTTPLDARVPSRTPAATQHQNRRRSSAIAYPLAGILWAAIGHSIEREREERENVCVCERGGGKTMPQPGRPGRNRDWLAIRCGAHPSTDPLELLRRAARLTYTFVSKHFSCGPARPRVLGSSPCAELPSSTSLHLYLTPHLRWAHLRAPQLASHSCCCDYGPA
jgi:hypothetical protein